MIDLQGVSKRYDGQEPVDALRSVTLRIQAGERVAIMGPSGSGKSSLLHMICGLDEATSGRVLIDGVDLCSLSDDERTRLRREKIGMIFQTFNLLPTMNAIENVALPLRLQGQSRSKAGQRARTLLDRVGLAARAKHRPDELSGGERQRVAIARALIYQPAILLGDEPTGNLDTGSGEAVLCLLEQLHREFNTTLVLVTHNPEAATICDRILSLRDGEIVREERFGAAEPGRNEAGVRESSEIV